MILAIPEYSGYPASPAQWERFYHTLNDKVYIQILPTTDPSYPDWEEIDSGASVREDMRQTMTLVRSQYSAKDYQTYLDEIVAYISEKWGDRFNDFMASDPGIMIAEYISAALDQMSWYLDRETDEHYMELARLISNVARLAQYLGYKPEPAVSASADVVVTLTNGPYGFDVPLATKHQFQGPNSLIFELPTAQVIPAGDTTKTVGVIQGKTYLETFVSDGTPNQQFNLSLVPAGQMLAKSSLFVTVSNVEWDEEDFLPYGADEVYEVSYLTSPPVLKFGDGVIGKIPPAGAEIRVAYVATSGKSAGLATSGTINRSLTSVVVNFQQIPISVTNPEPASGGDDTESIDSIKANAPRYFMAADRLVTTGDYAVLSGKFRGLAGAIAKAKAIIIRGVDQDLELQGLMNELTSDRSELDGYLDGIKADQGLIKGYTGSTAADTIRYEKTQIAAKNTAIRAATDDIDSQVVVTKADVQSAKDDLELARIRLDFVSFQELVGMGDGTTTIFSKTLAKKPITVGSLAVMLVDQTPTKSATDGNCDATPGRLVSATIGFASSDTGKMIRIGGEYRQIQKYINASTVEYSGPRIYGTSLIVEVYPPAIIGYDDGAGNITGVSAGSINYTSAVLSVTFTTPPQGISGKYGVPIICSYQYESDGIKDVINDADLHLDSALTDADVFSAHGSVIDGYADESDTSLGKVGTACDNIDLKANDSITKATEAGAIPDQIQNDIDAVYAYLNTIISGNCKANVVRVSCLVKDANGFYTAPSVALKQELKTYLDERKISVVQNSVVSGAFYLVKIRLVVEVVLETLFTSQAVFPVILANLDTMFKNRDYGQGLKRSEYYGVVDAVDGVKYSNIHIPAQTGEANSPGVAYYDPFNTETPPLPDSNGNVFPRDHEVITKWEVIISEIAATGV